MKDTPKAETVVAVMKAFAEQTNSLGLEGLRNNFWKLQARGPHPSKLTFNAHKLNRSKCRYNDIMCLDQSRVLLKPWPDCQGDFIHANWITHELLDYPFICTQGPLNQTCGDFWRMVWQENVELIIMLCRTSEENRNKCAQYWPLNQGQVLTFCGITIRAVEKRAGDPDVHCTALLLTYRGERRPLAHYQWVSWPDKFVPDQLTVPYTLLSSARARKTPTVIHCSAGIGRTGTLVVLELLSRTLLSCRTPVVSEIVWSVRSQRSRAVQNEEQYLYIHYLTVQRLVNKGIVTDKAVSRFCRDYEQYYFTRTHRIQIPLPVLKKKPRARKTAGPESITSKISTPSVSVIPATVPGRSPPIPATSRRQDIIATVVPGDSRNAQQQKKGKGTRKKKTQPTDVAEDYTPIYGGEMEKAPSARNTENPAQISPAATSPGKPSISRAQYNLQQEYYEAQNALLESYRKAQKALVKTYVRKQKMATDSKLVPVEADVIQNAQREAQATIEGVIGTKGSDGTKPIETETTTIPAVQDQPKSVYAFTDEVQKIKCMHENLTLKEDEIDRAEYVFMQPIYANTYGAQTGSRDVVEKYVMNMLPEQYFDRAMDDGAVYVAQTKSKENLDSAEKPQAASPMPKRK